MPDHRAHQYSVEPPQAKEMAVNLIRKQRKFAVEIDPTLRGMKDVVCIAIGAELEQRTATEEYAKGITCKTLDDACQFVVNCIDEELSFWVDPRIVHGHPVEWVFTIERNKGHRERRAS